MMAGMAWKFSDGDGALCLVGNVAKGIGNRASILKGETRFGPGVFPLHRSWGLVLPKWTDAGGINAHSMSLRTLFPHRFGTAARRHAPIVGFLLAFGLVCGCSHVPKVSVDWRGGPFFTPTNFEGAPLMPGDVRRVAVLPLAGVESLTPESVAALEQALQAALLGEGRFEIVPISPDFVQAVAGKPAVHSGDILPPALFDRIAREQGADAVLFVDITLYRPYSPLALGVRAKLARCDGMRTILWAFDTLFDARDPAVANSARRHATGGRDAVVDVGPAALQSPGRFAAYVFSDTFATLPRRPAPPPAPPKTKVSRHHAD